MVITNWNTRDLVAGLLHSLRLHAPSFPHEVIVVDNGSTDGSVESIAREFPAVRLIRNPHNEGYARANNQGFAHSSGRYILLLGSDTVLIDDSIRKMVEYAERGERVGAVSCRLLNPDRTPQRSCRRFPTIWDAVLTYLSLDSMARRYTMSGFDYTRTQDVDQPAATCLLLRREMVDALGGLFDERYSILYNDVDLCQRIRKAGWRIVYLGDCEIVHLGSRSTTRAHPELRLEMYRNILLYFETSAGAIARWVLMPILFVRFLAVTRSSVAFRLLLPPTTRNTHDW